MSDFLTSLSKLDPATLGAIAAFFGLIGAVVAAIITGIISNLVVSPFLGARDKQDREVEWRNHAIELTKLDMERKIAARVAGDTKPLRPSILDFLANYRDLQELGKKSPKELFLKIEDERITHVSSPPATAPPAPAQIATDAPPAPLTTAAARPKAAARRTARSTPKGT